MKILDTDGQFYGRFQTIRLLYLPMFFLLFIVSHGQDFFYLCFGCGAADNAKYGDYTREIRQGFLTGERALFQGANLKIYDSIFAFGESPLKESHDIERE